MSGPTVGELFAGYGGLGLAVKALWPDARTAWVSDIEDGPKRVLAHRFPDAPNLGDITTVDWSQVEPVDIITGGSPCQDLSHAGKRAGMKAGTRSGLWASMCDAIETLRPSLVIWENVRGAYSAEADSNVESCEFCMDDGSAVHLRALGRVLGDLSEVGYDATWVGLRAADVGACHGRFRVFVVAQPADAESVGRDWTGASRSGRHGLADSDRGTVALLPTPLVENNENRQSEGYGPNLGEALALLPTPGVADATGGHHSRSGARSNELLLNGIAHFDQWKQYTAAIVRQEHLFGRPAPAPTLPTGRDGKPQLSPVFEEWMMMLPKGWVTDPAIWADMKPSTARNTQVRLFGNGVVPAQATEAIRWCLERRGDFLPTT